MPKSVIRQAIPREQVHNADQVLNVLNLWYLGCGPCRAEMPELSTWKEQLPK